MAHSGTGLFKFSRLCLCTVAVLLAARAAMARATTSTGIANVVVTDGFVQIATVSARANNDSAGAGSRVKRHHEGPPSRH